MIILKKIAAGFVAFAVAVSSIPFCVTPVRAEELDGNSLRLWYDEPASQGTNILSHMLGLFPGDLVQQNPEWMAAAKVSMDYRTDNSTGWGMGQRINTWARLGEGNKAHELMGDGTFGINGNCNRAQAVTFLFRALAE